MLKSQKRSIIKVGHGSKDRTRDLTTIEPDVLRDRVYEALSKLSEDDRALMRDRLLARLDHAGLGIGASLLLLGIPAKTADDLTPSDIAKLLRYVCINKPEAIRSAASLLADLVVRDFGGETCVKPYRRAA